jgi:hypothetical protein
MALSEIGDSPPPKSPNFDRENADRPVGFRDMPERVEVLLGLSNYRSNDTRYAM